jgi:hypothetical protein
MARLNWGGRRRLRLRLSFCRGSRCAETTNEGDGAVSGLRTVEDVSFEGHDGRGEIKGHA